MLKNNFDNCFRLPCSSNLYKETEQHRLQFMWVGKNIDRYIRFIRLHLALCIASLVSAIIATLTMTAVDGYKAICQIFLPIIVVVAVLAIGSEETQNGEEFSKHEYTILFGSYVLGNGIFMIVFLTIELIPSAAVQVFYFFIALTIVFTVYNIPLVRYSKKVKENGKILFIGKFIGRKSPSLVIHLRSGDVLNFNQDFFYPIFDNSSVVTLLRPNEIGNCFVGKEEIESILYDGNDVTKEFL